MVGYFCDFSIDFILRLVWIIRWEFVLIKINIMTVGWGDLKWEINIESKREKRVLRFF